MENEVMNRETVENIVDAGRNSKVGKVVKTVGIIGLAAELVYFVCKTGKKLVAKVKAKKTMKKEKVPASTVPTDDMFEDLGELED